MAAALAAAAAAGGAEAGDGGATRLCGVLLIPVLSAVRGAFPLNGTYFQVGGWCMCGEGWWRDRWRGWWGMMCVVVPGGGGEGDKTCERKGRSHLAAPLPAPLKKMRAAFMHRPSVTTQSPSSTLPPSSAFHPRSFLPRFRVYCLCPTFCCAP